MQTSLAESTIIYAPQTNPSVAQTQHTSQFLALADQPNVSQPLATAQDTKSSNTYTQSSKQYFTSQKSSTHQNAQPTNFQPSTKPKTLHEMEGLSPIRFGQVSRLILTYSAIGSFSSIGATAFSEKPQAKRDTIPKPKQFSPASSHITFSPPKHNLPPQGSPLLTDLQHSASDSSSQFQQFRRVVQMDSAVATVLKNKNAENTPADFDLESVPEDLDIIDKDALRDQLDAFQRSTEKVSCYLLQFFFYLHRIML